MQSYKQKHSFDYLLGFHCTPALAGIKCANLLSVCHKTYDNIEQELDKLNRHFNSKSIFLIRLCLSQSRTLILVYGRELLERTIYQKENLILLQQEGYPIEKGLDCILEHLSFRLQSQQEFPHEIGIFLGYPLDDVLGFLEHQGRNYKISGYWKVYGDVCSAKMLFEKYTRCRNNVCNRIDKGMSLNQIFKTA